MHFFHLINFFVEITKSFLPNEQAKISPSTQQPFFVPSGAAKNERRAGKPNVAAAVDDDDDDDDERFASRTRMKKERSREASLGYISGARATDGCRGGSGNGGGGGCRGGGGGGGGGSGAAVIAASHAQSRHGGAEARKTFLNGWNVIHVVHHEETSS